MSFLSRIPRLIWRERELSVARLASTLTHTLGTPLQVIAGRAALARKTTDLDEVGRHLDIIQRKCSEITGVLWRVLESLRVEQPRSLGPVDVGALLETLVNELTEVGQTREVGWELRLLGDATDLSGLRLCGEDLRHALVSLALTVLAEAPDASQLLVTAEKTEQEGRGLTPVHDSVLRITFQRAGASKSVESGSVESGSVESGSVESGALAQQQVSDPWLHASGERVDGRALGWAAVYELARGNEGRLELSGDAVTLCWPVVS